MSESPGRRDRPVGERVVVTQVHDGGHRPAPTSMRPLSILFGALLAMLLVLALAFASTRSSSVESADRSVEVQQQSEPSAPGASDDRSAGEEIVAVDAEPAADESSIDLRTIAYVLAALIIASLVARRVTGRSRSVPTPAAIPDDATAERLAVVGDLIETLRSEPDPRRAIQRAFEALSSGFERPELRRLSNETSSAWLQRVLGASASTDTDEPLRSLTSLFELARYSDTEIGEPMRAQAIDALVVIRKSWSSPRAQAG